MHSYNTGRIAWRSKYNINSLTFYIISLLPQNPNAILSKSTELLSCSSYWFFMSHLITRVICNQFITFKSPPFQRLEQEKLYLLLSNSFWLFQCKLLYSWPFKKKNQGWLQTSFACRRSTLLSCLSVHRDLESFFSWKHEKTEHLNSHHWRLLPSSLPSWQNCPILKQRRQ